MRTGVPSSPSPPASSSSSRKTRFPSFSLSTFPFHPILANFPFPNFFSPISKPEDLRLSPILLHEIPLISGPFQLEFPFPSGRYLTGTITISRKIFPQNGGPKFLELFITVKDQTAFNTINVQLEESLMDLFEEFAKPGVSRHFLLSSFSLFSLFSFSSFHFSSPF